MESVTLRGTVTVVGMRLGQLDRFASYLITARHCVRKASESGDKVVLRMNTPDRGVRLIDISSLTWQCPENAASDIAVSGLIGDGFFSGLSQKSVDASMILTEQEAERVQVGLGEELICTGLFHPRQGDQRNIPIARFGNLAAMPEEPLIDEDSGLEYDAFLAEIRSIGGLSGSPVFARLDPGRKTAEGATVGVPQWFWLGVIRSHWNRAQFANTAESERELETFNQGIAQVTPAWEALELLDREDYVKERNKAERELRERDAPTKTTRKMATTSRASRT